MQIKIQAAKRLTMVTAGRMTEKAARELLEGMGLTLSPKKKIEPKSITLFMEGPKCTAKAVKLMTKALGKPDKVTGPVNTKPDTWEWMPDRGGILRLHGSFDDYCFVRLTGGA